MSVRVMSAVWEINLPDSEKLVLLALADAANDEGVCWPSMATLVRKCSKSDRTIQAAIKGLCAAGHLIRDERPGKGCLYTVTPRSHCTPEAASPPKGTTLTPEAASDKPSRTIKQPNERATTFPANFHPVMSGKTAATVDGWPPGRLDDELEAFADHHIAKGTTSLDWQASWRTWVRNSKKWEPRNAPIQRDNRANAKPRDGFSAALREASSFRQAGFG
jgi:hypothetical protein